MFTIEEARNSRPAVTRQIPHGAILEYADGDIQRALEEEERAQERVRVHGWNRKIDRIWRVLERLLARRAPAA